MNRRFKAGLANRDADGPPGVLIHMFDGFGDQTSSPWLPCPPTAEFEWCHKVSDRFSASLINSKIPTFYHRSGGGGFVVSAEHNQILCSWVADAGSMTRTCSPPADFASVFSDGTCVPGCSGGEAWCSTASSGYCPWRPTDLRLMVQQHVARGAASGYNEVILDAATWIRNLPHSIEAVLQSSEEDGEQASSVHRLFVEHFGADGQSPVPLVLMDLDADEPFQILTPG